MIGTATVESLVDHIINDLLTSLEWSADLVIYKDKEEYLEGVLHTLEGNLNICPKCLLLTLSGLIYVVYSCSFKHIHSCLSYPYIIEMILLCISEDIYLNFEYLNNTDSNFVGVSESDNTCVLDDLK